MLFQVIAQGFGDWKNGLLPGGFVGLVGEGAIKLHLCKIMNLLLKLRTNQPLAGGASQDEGR